MTISNELLDSLLADYKTPEDLIGEGGLLKQLTQRLVERALQAEMTEHLVLTDKKVSSWFSRIPLILRFEQFPRFTKYHPE